MPICRASSQFTGPLEDRSTRWISRNSGTSFQMSPSGTPSGPGCPSLGSWGSFTSSILSTRLDHPP
jgi:hypothetical protein